jgi:asparagine synthase (glutamine-hydrolysing)
MRAVSALRLPRREDYVEAFLEKFDQAVQTRLRFHPKYGGVASTLSGGLDSGSITATAARLLRPSGARISAFTSVPVDNTDKFILWGFGDEWPLARATAQFAGNVDHYPLPASEMTPIAAIRQALTNVQQPGHAAGNLFWMLELNRTVQAHGKRVLLSGQLGNAGISWAGDIFSQPPAFQVSVLGWKTWLKLKLKQAAPGSLLAAWYAFRTPPDWHRGSAIHPDFAKRLNLLELRLKDPGENANSSALEQRFDILKPGQSFIGASHAQMGAAAGIEIRDPSGDARLLNFCLALPDHIFMDPITRTDRWLIRAAMQGRLPDEVRLNRRRGSQAGDLVPRLRACAEEVEAALDELARGPAAAYLDVAYMCQVWNLIQTEDSPQTHGKAITVLTRGIMAGLFVNAF